MCRQLTVVVLAALLTTTLGTGLAAQKKSENNKGGKEDPLKKAVQRYEERIDRLEDLIRKASAEQKTLAENKLHRRMADEQAELQKRLTQLERELASTRDRFHKTESEIEHLRKRLIAEQEEREKLAQAHTVARKRIAEAEVLGRQLRDVQNQAKRSESMIKDLRRQLQHANTTLAKSKTAADTARRVAAEESRALERRVNALQAALSQSNDRVAAARDTAQRAESVQSDRSASIAGLQRQLKSMTKKYNDLRRQRTAKKPAQALAPAVAATPEVSDGTGIHIHNQGGTVVMHVNGVGAPAITTAAEARKKALAARRGEKNEKKAQPKKRINI